MNISVFGLGYVGCVTGACLADGGHMVIGVDVNKTKVDMVNNAKPPIIEKDISELTERVVKLKRYAATTDAFYAMQNSDIALVCVGTPSRPNGSINLMYIKRVAQYIGTALRKRDGYYLVVIRSTVLPGTVDDIVVPILEKCSGKRAGIDFGVCMNPEFLREGSSIHDFHHPPKNVIGEIDNRSGDLLLKIYNNIDAPVFRTKIRTAEMVKYADNCFHGLKVSFANEIGNLCKKMTIDSHEVMGIFCQDTKLNLSPNYLKPGFAFGGSCLPKDLRAIMYESKALDLELPVLGSILESNRRQIARVVNFLMQYKGKKIGFMGLSFKGGTDDLRESPVVEVIETLIGKGFHINIYDKYVSVSRLMGANKEYIEREIPHISSLMCMSVDELIFNADVLVVCNHSDENEAVIKKVGSDHVIVDLVRFVENGAGLKCTYHGICW